MIRLATEEDFGEVLRMTKAFHQASPYSDIEFSDHKIRQVFDLYLTDPRQVVVLVIGSPAHGVLIGTSQAMLFSEEKVAVELVWYVDEEHRSKDSLVLMDAYSDWAIRVGSKITSMTMLPEVTDLDRLYRRSGYTPAESSYIKRNY